MCQEISILSYHPLGSRMVHLTDTDTALLTNTEGPALALAMRIVVETAKILGAPKLIPIASAHIDGCLYHGDSGVYFAERLVELGGVVCVPGCVCACAFCHLGRRAFAHCKVMFNLVGCYITPVCCRVWLQYASIAWIA